MSKVTEFNFKHPQKSSQKYSRQSDVQRECKSIPVYENFLNLLTLVINRNLPERVYLQTSGTYPDVPKYFYTGSRMNHLKPSLSFSRHFFQIHLGATLWWVKPDNRDQTMNPESILIECIFVLFNRGIIRYC